MFVRKSSKQQCRLCRLWVHQSLMDCVWPLTIPWFYQWWVSSERHVFEESLRAYLFWSWTFLVVAVAIVLALFVLERAHMSLLLHILCTIIGGTPQFGVCVGLFFSVYFEGCESLPSRKGKMWLLDFSSLLGCQMWRAVAGQMHITA